MEKKRKLFGQENIPAWYKVYNFLGLSPVLAWPFIAFGSIFLFDHPSNVAITAVLVLLIVAYPLYVFGLVVLGFKLYHTYRSIAILIPTILIFLLLYFLQWLL